MVEQTGWFFGDSFLYGYQCHPGNPYYEKSKYKDKRIVSQIVCDALNIKHKNLAQYGYSNENILHSVLTNVSNIKENDYVFIIDTHSTRTPIVYDHKNVPICMTENYYTGWPDGSYIEVKRSEAFEQMDYARQSVTEKLNDFYKDIFNGLIEELSLRNVNTVYIPTNRHYGIVYGESNELEAEQIWDDESADISDGHWSFKGHRKMASMILGKIEGYKGLI